MKNNFYYFLSIGLLCLVLNTSCKKEDDEAPVITPTPADVTPPVVQLHGSNPMYLELNDGFDYGANATDDRDGARTTLSDWYSVVKLKEVNSYTVTYVAYDNAGNRGTATRVVKVKSDLLGGSYNCSDYVNGAVVPSNNGTFSYEIQVTKVSNEFNKLKFNNLGGFGDAVILYATVSGTAITIPVQTVNVPGKGLVTLSGSGTYNGDEKKITSLNYTTDGFGNGIITLSKL